MRAVGKDLDFRAKSYGGVIARNKKGASPCYALFGALCAAFDSTEMKS